MYIDKEYALLESLSEKESVSQRRLSQILNISLGSVNMLINKMQKDGLIKLKNISPNTVAYILTPKGIAEKANKTYKYMAFHYRRINDTKEKIKRYLERVSGEEEMVYLVLDDSEMSQIVRLALGEMGKLENVVVLGDRDLDEVEDAESMTILLKEDDKIRRSRHRVAKLLEEV